eukprot:scaffold6103_cov116-Cylindrotheca_fusiformis.AAC.1
MALSTGGIVGILIAVLVINAAGFFYLKKNPDAGPKYTLDEKFHPTARWIILGLTIVSWIFSVAATASCAFVKYETKYFGLTVSSTRGFNNVADGDGGCIAIDSS